MAATRNLPQPMPSRFDEAPRRAHSTPDPDDVPPSGPERGPDDDPEPDAPPVQEPDRPHAPMSAF